MSEETNRLEDLLNRVMEHFNCELVPFVVRKYTPSLEYLYSRLNHLDSNDETMLRNLFVKENIFWQTTLFALYRSSYPLVCDVFTSVASLLVVSLLHDYFEVFTVNGKYGNADVYHQWVLAVSRKSKIGYYIDSTYIQFLPGIKTSHSILGPDGRAIEIQDFSGLRQNVANRSSMSQFPVSVIRVGSALSMQWNPENFCAIIRKNI